MRKLIAYFIINYSLITFSAMTNAALPLTIAGSDTFSLAPLVEKTSPAVANISIVVNQSNQQLLPDLFDFFSDDELLFLNQPVIGLGSGVIIDAAKGYIITNFHVIEDAQEIRVTLTSGQEFNALLVGHDQQSDIALLQINSNKSLTQMLLADSDLVRVGDFVIAIGNPLGLGQTVTSGIISALGRSGLNFENLENFIQTDATINSGSSGGALVNLSGELIGINTALLASSGGNIGIGFAIPSNMINNLVDQLLQFGEVRRGVLGIKGGELTHQLTKVFGLESKHGAFIYQINPDSAAEQAGLEAGDVIVSLDGLSIISFSALRAKIGSLSVGKKVELGIIRDAKALSLSATLKAIEPGKIKFIPPPLHPLLAGATLMNPAGGNKNKGVLVDHVKKGSIADDFGLQQGDLIIGINRKKILNLTELTEFIKSSPPVLALNIVRENRKLYLILHYKAQKTDGYRPQTDQNIKK